MPYMLKPKHYAMATDINPGRIYRPKWRSEPYTIYHSPYESNLIIDNELSVVKFLRSRIQEDIADSAQKKYVNYYKFIVDLDGKPFRELIKYNCAALKYGSNSVLREASWQEKYSVHRMSSSPRNYKIFKLETVVSNGITLQRQIPMTWHKFFKKCKELGLEQECVYREMK